MKQKIIAVLMALILVLGLAACGVEKSDKEVYEVIKTGDMDYSVVNDYGKHYIILDTPEDYPHDTYHEDIPELQFTSVKEFKDAVTQGKLTEEQKKTMGLFERDENGNIITCNFNSLYVPVAPEAIASPVAWWGEDYAVYVTFKENSGAIFLPGTKEEYDETIESMKEDLESEDISKTEKDGNKTITYFNDGDKYVDYTLSRGNKKFYIRQFFVEISLEIHPDGYYHFMTMITAEENGRYYAIHLYNDEETPSDDFILKLGMEKYKG